MRTFTVKCEVPEPPAGWEEDARQAVEAAGGREFLPGGGPSPHAEFAYVIDANDEASAASHADELLKGLFGRFSYGVVTTIEERLS